MTPVLRSVSKRTPSKGEQTAVRILDAAEALFAEHGFAGTTLRGVAAVVGLRTPSLYNHFPSKEQLYSAVLERGLRPVLEMLAGIVQEADPADEGSRQVRNLMEILSQRPNLPRLLQHEVLTGGEHLSPLLREWIRPLFMQARSLVESSPAARRWSDEEIPLLVLALYNVIIGYFTLAPVYADLDGGDLMAPEFQRRQTLFLQHLIEVLLLEWD